MRVFADAAKALELFMQDIVACSVEHTRKSGGKRVAPYHLCVAVANIRKRATQTNETFDFLKDIVEKVPDPHETGGARGGKRRKVAKTETSDSADAPDSAESSKPAAAEEARAAPAAAADDGEPSPAPKAEPDESPE